MTFLYGVCHQSSSYCLLVTYLHFLFPTRDGVFSPRKAFGQTAFHITNLCGISAFGDEALSLQRCSREKQPTGSGKRDLWQTLMLGTRTY